MSIDHSLPMFELEALCILIAAGAMIVPSVPVGIPGGHAREASMRGAIVSELPAIRSGQDDVLQSSWEFDLRALVAVHQATVGRLPAPIDAVFCARKPEA